MNKEHHYVWTTSIKLVITCINLATSYFKNSQIINLLFTIFEVESRDKRILTWNVFAVYIFSVATNKFILIVCVILVVNYRKWAKNANGSRLEDQHHHTSEIVAVPYLS